MYLCVSLELSPRYSYGPCQEAKFKFLNRNHAAQRLMHALESETDGSVVITSIPKSMRCLSLEMLDVYQWSPKFGHPFGESRCGWSFLVSLRHVQAFHILLSPKLQHARSARASFNGHQGIAERTIRSLGCDHLRCECQRSGQNPATFAVCPLNHPNCLAVLQDQLPHVSPQAPLVPLA
ncbi:hypothetical protein BDN72DRAFT_525720 [Pluteus cervinus]|uniref:Uncharacterized protein n=1 Tax=Pluteus cervinus TaxID=181527 RepID=A0ACD3AYE1_9AGAR|nr:hypothetical protein BDN72DRAFT_525720 [Pluteus cervinus]